MTTVAEWVSSACMGGGTVEFDSQIEKYRNLKIVKEFDGTVVRFPQTHFLFRNVMNWVLLEDGSAVGWNESPRTGWSFPRIGKKTVSQNFKG